MGQGRAVVLLLVVVAFISCAKAPAPTPPATVPQQQEQPKAEAAPVDPISRAKSALALFDQKRYDEAVPALAAAALEFPEVAPFLRLRIVEAEIARGNFKEAAAMASQIEGLERRAESPSLQFTSAATVARLRLPAIFAQLGHAAATDAAWQQASQIAIDELTEADFVAMATALAKAGRNDLAVKTRMRLLTDYTNGRYTEQTYDFLTAEIDALPVAEKIALAGKLSRANRYDEALELFSRIPGGAPEARATRLRALFNSRNYGQLLVETKDVQLGDPSLMLLRARAAWRDDKPQEFLSGLDAVEKQFPASKEALDAKIARAKYYSTDVIDYAKSVENLTQAIDAGHVGGDGENIWTLGWTYTLWGKYDEALKVFDRYVRSYPDGDWKTNSLFWSAKIHDKLGRTQQRNASAQQIVDEFPFSYYAYRAKELWSDGLLVRRQAERPSLQTFPDIEAELAKITEPRFDVVHALQDIGLDRAAAREMKVLAGKYSSNPGVQFMLADVYVRGGEPFKANTVLQRQFRSFVRHGGANIPPRFWQILFPLAYWETLQAEAQRRGVDPYLLASITRQESGFEPSTVSNAGAVGLMQIMPEEASRIATAGGLGSVTRGDLFVPERNIAVGAAEYAQKLQAMNGNHVLAIASYNAGEKAVGTWLEKTPIDDLDLFVESIPYAETRLYVKTVTRNRFEYRRIYEGSAAAEQQRSEAQ
ncbi:MAG TPA: transglycosylase SLT domain-containing protein [Thermoanaerobaculia bacterium]|nr:transglycosylase SLT domain-containing protein [Thermoanaerobaculia bacterium]